MTEIKGGYHIIPIEGQAYLDPQQNFVDQRPFLDLPTIVGQDFFKEPDNVVAIATLVRFITTTDPELFRDNARIKPIRSLTNLENTQIFQAWDIGKQFIDDTPYLEDYIEYYWLRERKQNRIFNVHGEPIPKVTEEAESFARYQDRMIRVDRALSYLGTEDESHGLSGPDTVRSAINRTPNSPIYRHWRLITKSDALK